MSKPNWALPAPINTIRVGTALYSRIRLRHERLRRRGVDPSLLQSRIFGMSALAGSLPPQAVLACSRLASILPKPSFGG